MAYGVKAILCGLSGRSLMQVIRGGLLVLCYGGFPTGGPFGELREDLNIFHYLVICRREYPREFACKGQVGLV